MQLTLHLLSVVMIGSIFSGFDSTKIEFGRSVLLNSENSLIIHIHCFQGYFFGPIFLEWTFEVKLISADLIDLDAFDSSDL